MQIIEVISSLHKKEFLEFPARLYKNDPNWIRPLDQDMERIFDPEKNLYFTHGTCIRWLLADNTGKTIGQVAAFIDFDTASKETQPTGGMGFFECIDDVTAARLLFDTCKKWLESQGMEAMDGPINFGERDQWWGLLVDGFRPPNYGMFYHMPYYRHLFESYGFLEYFQQYTYYREVMIPPHPAIVARAERIRSNPDYTFAHIEKRYIDKYTEDFRTIYNKGWVDIKGDKPEMTFPQAKALVKKFKPIMDEKIIWFAYYKGEPVAFFIVLPEMNQVFKYVHGKLNLLGIAKFLWHKWRKTCRKMFGVVFGVVPEHQGKAVEAAIIMAMRDVVQETYKQYDDMEMNWIGDFNPRMMKLIEMFGAKIIKTHITYRKLFDETKPYERHPIIR